MALQERLEKKGFRVESVEDSYILERLKQIHRPVGKIELRRVTRAVNLALELTGSDQRVTEGKYRSMFRPEMLEEPLVKFCTGSQFRPRNRKALELAIKSVKKKFAKRTTHPVPIGESYDRLMLDKADHFAGLPTLGKKGDDTEAVKRAEQCWEGKCPPPAVIGHRGKNTEVVRAVWMFPFEWHIVEGCFYFPLYDIIKANQTIYPVGVISERRYLMRKYCDNAKYNTKFSIDYSGFDACVNTQMIGIAFSILSEMLELDAHQQKVWERVQTYFATCPFLAPDGKVYKGRKGGVPSGSMFTQMVDSVANAVAIEYAMACENVKDFRYLVYGDDSWTILTIGEAPLKFLARIETHVRSLGLNMNLEKTAYAEPKDPLCFCGHYDIKRGRPLQDCIDKMCYPERPSERYKTKEGICERIMAYIADADLLTLNAVYLAFYYNISVQEILASAPNNLTELMFQGVEGNVNIRHLPGILQVIHAAPKETGTLMKIRSAI